MRQLHQHRISSGIFVVSVDTLSGLPMTGAWTTSEAVPVPTGAGPPGLTATRSSAAIPSQEMKGL